jgi:hypothetical protein
MEIAVRGLVKSFDGQSAALDGVDLDVAASWSPCSGHRDLEKPRFCGS